MTNLLSAFVGITTPAPELHAQIAQQGWEVTKVKWDKKLDAFVAEAKGPHGDKLAKTGPNDRTALGNLLNAIVRRTHMRTTAQYKLGMWKTMFTDQLKPIAEAYAKAPQYDAKAAGCFKELAEDSVRRAEVLKRQLHIEVVDNPEPYPNAQAMAEDIHKNKHFLVSRANSDHPLWTVDQNVAFRIVHDVLGHAVSGGDFGWQGENLACAAHFPLLSQTAQQALFTECIAQTAYAGYYRSFGPQKVALFPEFTDPSQANENQPGHTGIHPSQVAAPTSMPDVGVSPNAEEAHGALPEGTIAPHQQQLGLSTFAKYAASAFTDPNKGWSSGQQPMTLQTHGVGNAYLDHGDPLQSADVMDNASLVDTKWHKLTRGDGSLDRDHAKQAIVNAFRVVLLSPRKDLRWNAIHYQDISHIPASVDDPKTYWDALEGKRRAWNKAQGIDENSHMIYFKYLKPFEAVIRQMHPSLSFEEAKVKAERTLFQWWSEEQGRIEREDEEKPSHKQRGADEIERRANEALAKRMQMYLKDKVNPDTDGQDVAPPPLSLFSAVGDDYIKKVKDRFGSVNLEDATIKFKASQIKNFLNKSDLPDRKCDELMRLYAYLAKSKGRSTTAEDIHDAWPYWTVVELKDTKDDCLIPYSELSSKSKSYDEPYKDVVHKISAGGQYNLLTGQEALKYGAFMGTHLKAISQISRHADELLDAALEDVHQHDGTGHHFRAKTLQLGVSGVGPKVCSFAWLMLQPMTSQLATIDTHMMDVLGHDYDKEMNNRDYFKFERELAAGRDASGYGHVPLGAFQWGMWDHKRTGAGSHQDHSAMRVLEPVSHHHIDWVSKAQNLKGDSWLQQAPDWWRNTQSARDAAAKEFDTKVAPGTPQGGIPYQTIVDPTTASQHVASGESVDEFHIGIDIPESVMIRCAEIAGTLEMDEDSPEEYHLTAFWSEHGYEDHELHEWVRKSTISGFRFQNARLDSFPGANGKSAVVLKFDAPEAKVMVEELMDQAEDRGLDIKRFDGGWKPHITLGWTKEPLSEKTKFPDIAFRSGSLYVSIPRPIRKTADGGEGFAALNLPTPFAQYAGGERDVGAPGESAMAFARLMHPELSTPQIWKLMGESGAGKLDGAGQSYPINNAGDNPDQVADPNGSAT